MRTRYGGWLAGGVLIVAATVAIAQEPEIFLRPVEVHSNRLLLGTSVTLIFEGATADAYETTLTVADPTADRTWTVPDSASDTFVGLAATQTLTNKTLTSPTLTAPSLGVATATSLNGLTITTSTGTLTVPNGVVLTGPASTGTAMTLGNAETVTGVKTFVGATAGAATAALVMGGGTSTTPMATSTADKNFLGFWSKSTATSGDSRGIYLRHYIMGAGGAGEAARFYTTVDDVAAAGTVNGAHISLSVTADGSASGASNALRSTYDIAANGAPGGTAAVIQVDSNFGASATIPTNFAYLRFDNVGSAPTTNGVAYLFNITNADDGLFVNGSGTGAGECAQTGGVVFTKAVAVTIGGVNYWIPLCTAN